MGPHAGAFWSIPPPELLLQLETSPLGLTSDEVRSRLAQFGPNLLRPRKRSDAGALLVAQFQSPIILILLFAAGLSLFLHDQADALIILAIILISGLLGFWQEKGAALLFPYTPSGKILGFSPLPFILFLAGVIVLLYILWQGRLRPPLAAHREKGMAGPWWTTRGIILASGVMRMSPIKFLLADAASALFTILVLGGIGYAGGNSIQVLKKDITRIEHFAIVAIVILIAGWFIYSYFKNNGASRDQSEGGSRETTATSQGPER